MIPNKTSESVIITGANRGIGLGFVKYYLQKGWFVVACCRTTKPNDDLKILLERYKDQLKIEALDISKDESIIELVKRINHLEFNLVINNAGVYHDENFGAWTSEIFLNTFKVNAIGVALFSQAIIPFIKSNGKFINMSSRLGSMDLNINPEMGFDAYAMSKAALNILSKRLASKLKSKNISVIALSPGWVHTDMGGSEAPKTVEEAVNNIGRSIDKFSIENSGQFLSDEGISIPW